jgi:cation:H+ antiporter
MIQNIRLQQNVVYQKFPLLIFCEILLVYLTADYLLHGKYANRVISNTDGWILLILFCCLSVSVIKGDLKKNIGNICFGRKQRLCILAGTAFSVIFGELLRKGEKNLCTMFSCERDIFYMLIVAMVISLPKLIAAIIAMKKKRVTVFIENIVYCNITDCLLVLGLGSILCAVPATMNMIYDLIILCVSSIVVWLLAVRKREIGRLQGCIMVTGYVAYMVYLIVR